MFRRNFVAALGLIPLAAMAQASPQKNSGAAALPDTGWLEALARIEASVGGRVGVAVLDTHTGRQIAHRGGERFPMASTFKLLLAAQTLRRVDQGQDKLDRRITYAKKDLVTYSPVTEPHADGAGLTVEELCAGTMTLSDNTAANLLLASNGGPAALTAYVRSLGDSITRLDRNEPALNEAKPGDPRDTTTPQAMVHCIQVLALGDALSPASREKLQGWLLANKTGDKRLRARLPEGWKAGEKTGTASRGTSNDAGVFWPPGRKPVVVSCYLTGGEAPPEQREAAMAEIGALVAQWAVTV
ncbi:class A beta-lactamase [Acidovorax sp. LjRoot129]|uniref:class A beta-lactamase n=1 Tax=Acidovorax sp. LjRoot129 TaxID=3342260 RepID=UPI003ECE3C6F